MSIVQSTNIASEERYSASMNAIALVVAMAGVVTILLPFAFSTSPWDAVRLKVPENQGNWWHVLVGAPFFLAFPLLWLRIRSLWSDELSTVTGRRFVWICAGLSVAGTVAVEFPFLLHLAGTSDWQRLVILTLGFGIVIASGAMLFARRHNIPPTRACLVALNAAYLANAALCLVVYAGAPGPVRSRSGWLVTGVIVWPMLVEIILIFAQSFRSPPLSRSRGGRVAPPF